MSDQNDQIDLGTRLGLCVHWSKDPRGHLLRPIELALLAAGVLLGPFMLRFLPNSAANCCVTSPLSPLPAGSVGPIACFQGVLERRVGRVLEVSRAARLHGSAFCLPEKHLTAWMRTARPTGWHALK